MLEHMGGAALILPSAAPRPAPGAKRQGRWAAFSHVTQLHRSVCPLSLQLQKLETSLIPAPHIAFDAKSRISDWATDGYMRPFC